MTWIYWKVAHSGGVRGESQWIWGGAVQSDHFAMLGLHLHPTCFNVKFEFYQLKLWSIGPVWIITAVFNLNGHGHSLPSGKSNCPHCPNAVPHLHYVYHTCTTCTTFCTTCAQTPYWHRWSADQNASYQLELRRVRPQYSRKSFLALSPLYQRGAEKHENDIGQHYRHFTLSAPHSGRHTTWPRS